MLDEPSDRLRISRRYIDNARACDDSIMSSRFHGIDQIPANRSQFGVTRRHPTLVARLHIFTFDDDWMDGSIGCPRVEASSRTIFPEWHTLSRGDDLFQVVSSTEIHKLTGVDVPAIDHLAMEHLHHDPRYIRFGIDHRWRTTYRHQV
jgi:hypothetical protein